MQPRFTIKQKFYTPVSKFSLLFLFLCLARSFILPINFRLPYFPPFLWSFLFLPRWSRIFLDFIFIFSLSCLTFYFSLIFPISVLVFMFIFLPTFLPFSSCLSYIYFCSFLLSIFPYFFKVVISHWTQQPIYKRVTLREDPHSSQHQIIKTPGANPTPNGSRDTATSNTGTVMVALPSHTSISRKTSTENFQSTYL